MGNADQTYNLNRAGAHILTLITDGYGTLGGIAQYNLDIISSIASTKTVASISVLPINGTPHVSHPVIK